MLNPRCQLRIGAVQFLVLLAQAAAEADSTVKSVGGLGGRGGGGFQLVEPAVSSP